MHFIHFYKYQTFLMECQNLLEYCTQKTKLMDYRNDCTNHAKNKSFLITIQTSNNYTRFKAGIKIKIHSKLFENMALAHLKFGHYAVLPNKFAWILWKMGIVELSNRRILRKCSSILAEPSLDALTELGDEKISRQRVDFRTYRRM